MQNAGWSSPNTTAKTIGESGNQLKTREQQEPLSTSVVFQQEPLPTPCVEIALKRLWKISLCLLEPKGAFCFHYLLPLM
ncbi:hypothetical protein DPEC_G00117630 [Dallia pectoralis]|uniref:Uncharacterized protein n=1 Tax=Dallia pectoralis TaxID=75939 RepID=A0ACC2GVL6_DALPE|nr:hypothetical protein DPEC_G00117630 [Dallia pectoralis]